MRKAVTLFAVCAFASGIASAQYKKSAPAATPMPVNANNQTAQLEMALAKVRRVSEAEASRLATNGAAVIVDVRSNSQFALGHIKGSLNIPGSQLVSRIKELPPGKTIITYCA